MFALTTRIWNKLSFRCVIWQLEENCRSTLRKKKPRHHFFYISIYQDQPIQWNIAKTEKSKKPLWYSRLWTQICALQRPCFSPPVQRNIFSLYRDCRNSWNSRQLQGQVRREWAPLRLRKANQSLFPMLWRESYLHSQPITFIGNNSALVRPYGLHFSQSSAEILSLNDDSLSNTFLRPSNSFCFHCSILIFWLTKFNWFSEREEAIFSPIRIPGTEETVVLQKAFLKFRCFSFFWHHQGMLFFESTTYINYSHFEYVPPSLYLSLNVSLTGDMQISLVDIWSPFNNRISSSADLSVHYC